MSLSAKHHSDPTYHKWREMGEVLLAAGLVHVNSAGNLGPGSEPHNMGAPATNPPAWFHPSQKQVGGRTSMITIGATDEDDGVREYSSTGPVTWEFVEQYKDYVHEKGKQQGLVKPDVCGPSETPSIAKSGTGYTDSFGGTSSATPHVAAVVTLLLSARPDLTPEQTHEALAMSAVQIISPYNNECGAGRVDAVAAVDYANTHFR